MQRDNQQIKSGDCAQVFGACRFPPSATHIGSHFHGRIEVMPAALANPEMPDLILAYELRPVRRDHRVAAIRAAEANPDAIIGFAITSSLAFFLIMLPPR
jgi:hypothetical protein